MTIGAFSGPRGIKTVGGGAGPPPVDPGDDTRVAFALGGILEYATGVLITGAGQDELTVTGHINIGTAPFAGAGELRLPHASTIQGRDSTDTFDRDLINWGATAVDRLDFGDTAIGTVQFIALTTVAYNVGGGQRLRIGVTNIEVIVPILRFNSTQVNPVLEQGGTTGPVAGMTLTVHAQNQASALAGPFAAGDLNLEGGDITGALNTGPPGAVNIIPGTLGAGGGVAPNINFVCTSVGTTDFQVPSPALGGGAAATLGTIGGAGPTAAGQAQWLEVEVSSVRHWIAVWV